MGMHPAVQGVQSSMKEDGLMIPPGTNIQHSSFGASTVPTPVLHPPQNTKSSVEAMVSFKNNSKASYRDNNRNFPTQILEGAEFGDGSVNPGSNGGIATSLAGQSKAGPRGKAAAASAAFYEQKLASKSAHLLSKSSLSPGNASVTTRQESFYSRSLVNDTISGNQSIHVGDAVQTSVSGLLTSVLSPAVSKRSTATAKSTKWSGSARVAAADVLGHAIQPAQIGMDAETQEN